MGLQGTELRRKIWPSLCMLVLMAGHCWAEPQDTVTIPQGTLNLGQTRTTQIGGGQVHSFTIQLTRDQFAEIHVEQRGAILRATLFDPDGGEVIEMDYPGGGFGPIYLSTIAESSGNYRLEIRSTNKWALTKDYVVTLRARRNATPTDQPFVKAQSDFSQARKKFRANDYSGAIEAYNKSLAYWRSSDDYHWQAVIQFALSDVYQTVKRGEVPKYLEETLRLLKSRNSEDDWRLMASAFINLGIFYSNARQFAPAVSNLNNALDLYTAHGDRRGQASALNSLAQIEYHSGNLSRAAEMFEKSRAFRIAENDKPGASTVLSNLSAVSDRIGEPTVALKYSEEALSVWKEVGETRTGDAAQVAGVLSKIAALNDKLQRWDQAFEFYEKALDKYDKRDPDRANVLDNEGELYAALGNPAKARECYEEGLSILEAAASPNPDYKASIWVHFGQLYMTDGDLVTALDYFKRASNLTLDEYRLADIYTNLGEAFARQGNLDEAMAAYQKALDYQIALQNKRGQALALQKRGEARVRMRKIGEALEDFNNALAFWKAVKDRRGEAATLNSIARLERERENFEAALVRNAEAIQIIESLRTSISNRQLQTSYFAAQENYYELDVDLKMELSRKDRRADYLAAAFESAERSRARVLLDILNEARLNRGETKELTNTRLAKLRDARAKLLGKLAAKNEARTRILSSSHSAQQIAFFDGEINQLSDKLDVLESKIRTQDPRFTSLTKPKPATLKEIQQQLDPDTLLIEYFLGQTKSYVWLVSRDAPTEGFELPPREQVEKLAERVYMALSARGLTHPNESGPQRMERVAKEEKEFASAAAGLSKVILEPLGSRLGQKRLVVIADGALQTLPLGVLPALPRAVSVASTNNVNSALADSPLLASNEIVNLPSASVLVLQRRELAQRKPAPRAVAVLADPVFDDKDERVAARTNKDHRNPATISLPAPHLNKAINSFQSRALDNVGISETVEIRRLPYSLQEARAIFKVADPGQTFKALDFDASRVTAMSPELAKYRIIHLATHGIVNLRRPELSGVLFSTVDKQGRPQNGYLGLNEIYSLNLPADLVVLSACETGIGKQIRREGLIALTRGFMNAGAERVVASLWKVDDRATAELMGEFYNEMFVHKLKPAAALRAAQLKLSQRPAWRNPHFWAGFVLQGEWR